MDRLVLYAMLLAAVALIVRFIYQFYCTRFFEECRYSPVLDKPMLKEMFGFAGWSFLGSGVELLNTHGLNLLSNLFFGVAVNAARGVASQAGSAFWGFVDNFTMAINPQIIKNYAAGEMRLCFLRVCQSAKYCCFLALLVFIPLMLEADYVLNLWLKDVPDYATLFFRLTMLDIIVDWPGRSIEVLAKATGHVRTYYIKTGMTAGLIFPITYILFELGFAPYTAYVVRAVVYVLLLVVRMKVVQTQVGFPVRQFLQEMLRVSVVTILSFVLPVTVRLTMQEGLGRLSLIIVAGLFSLLASTFYIGMEKDERLKAVSFLKSKMNGIC